MTDETPTRGDQAQPDPTAALTGDNFRKSFTGAFGLTVMQHSITLADTKSGAVLTASTALNGITLALLHGMADARPWNCLEVIAIGLMLIALVALTTSAVLAWMVIWPVRTPKNRAELFYCRSGNYEGQDALLPTAATLLSTDADVLSRTQAKQIAQMGIIANGKFKRFGRAIAGGAIGFASFFAGQLALLANVLWWT